ncbi:DUF1826 domain-containing protein [Methylomonas methanica]|uniref:DUF1826 domain-containing protein n=1 Tax=Methylomonas methanica (strain DSM 25384 / MC09) TaxID=857087 RepID=G0A2M3_METMM|nr:DUF1826 domain-containing protein [Methylomonas methanica]AEG00203.1 protein of unknown function DUF1826 [Methylomonas methanica MC09]
MFARVPFRQQSQVSPVPAGEFRPLFNRLASKTIVSNNFADLSRIYEDGVNLCLIERPFPAAIEQFVYRALENAGGVEISQAVDPLNFDFGKLWPRAAQVPAYQDWLADVEMLVSAFCELFGRREAGLRLRTLDKAMCPRFHVDRVPARMICSYGGIGTEWLPEYALDRAKLGVGGRGLPDAESGLIADPTAIRQMPAYAVGLMKGENWEGNEGHGLVHRSPQPTAVQSRRLIMTLDVV